MPYPGKTNPDAIRAAALNLLEREGHAALTLRRLAGELGLVPNALYRYFASREILVAAVADEVARQLVQRATDRLIASETAMGPAGLDPIARIRILAKVYAAFGEDHPALYETLTADRSEAEATLPRPLGHDLLWELVIGTLTPLTGEEAAPAAAVTLWGLLHGLWSLQRANLLGGKKPADIAPFAIDALLEGMIRVNRFK